MLAGNWSHFHGEFFSAHERAMPFISSKGLSTRLASIIFGFQAGKGPLDNSSHCNHFIQLVDMEDAYSKGSGQIDIAFGRVLNEFYND